jgi:hypothetical protein
MFWTCPETYRVAEAVRLQRSPLGVRICEFLEVMYARAEPGRATAQGSSRDLNAIFYLREARWPGSCSRTICRLRHRVDGDHKPPARHGRSRAGRTVRPRPAPP